MDNALWMWAYYPTLREELGAIPRRLGLPKWTTELYFSRSSSLDFMVKYIDARDRVDG
jgi:hypothetical protein